MQNIFIHIYIYQWTRRFIENSYAMVHYLQQPFLLSFLFCHKNSWLGFVNALEIEGNVKRSTLPSTWFTFREVTRGITSLLIYSHFYKFNYRFRLSIIVKPRRISSQNALHHNHLLLQTDFGYHILGIADAYAIYLFFWSTVNPLNF